MVEVTYDEVLHGTYEAVKLLIGDREVWLPFSTIKDVDDDQDLDWDGGTIEVVESMAVEKELC